ncbi:hypothetical protein, partial [Limnospira platensis]|uniref:hypothetical protein n=1 Tax=Limnospira platensis TaxID=118562 RepID=UPI00396CC04E
MQPSYPVCCGWLGARAAVLSCVLCVAGLGRVQQSYPVCCDWLGARAAVLSCVLWLAWGACSSLVLCAV